MCMRQRTGIRSRRDHEGRHLALGMAPPRPAGPSLKRRRSVVASPFGASEWQRLYSDSERDNATADNRSFLADSITPLSRNVHIQNGRTMSGPGLITRDTEEPPGWSHRLSYPTNGGPLSHARYLALETQREEHNRRVDTEMVGRTKQTATQLFAPHRPNDNAYLPPMDRTMALNHLTKPAIRTQTGIPLHSLVSETLYGDTAVGGATIDRQKQLHSVGNAHVRPSDVVAFAPQTHVSATTGRSQDSVMNATTPRGTVTEGFAVPAPVFVDTGLADRRWDQQGMSAYPLPMVSAAVTGTEWQIGRTQPSVLRPSITDVHTNHIEAVSVPSIAPDKSLANRTHAPSHATKHHHQIGVAVGIPNDPTVGGVALHTGRPPHLHSTLQHTNIEMPNLSESRGFPMPNIGIHTSSSSPGQQPPLGSANIPQYLGVSKPNVIPHQWVPSSVHRSVDDQSHVSMVDTRINNTTTRTAPATTHEAEQHMSITIEPFTTPFPSPTMHTREGASRHKGGQTQDPLSLCTQNTLCMLPLTTATVARAPTISPMSSSHAMETINQVFPIHPTTGGRHSKTETHINNSHPATVCHTTHGGGRINDATANTKATSIIQSIGASIPGENERIGVVTQRDQNRSSMIVTPVH